MVVCCRFDAVDVFADDQIKQNLKQHKIHTTSTGVHCSAVPSWLDWGLCGGAGTRDHGQASTVEFASSCALQGSSTTEAQSCGSSSTISIKAKF
jgi:hypothetical protein